MSDLIQQYITHMRAKHPEEAKKVALGHMHLMQVGVWYIVMANYASWTEDEKYISEEYKKWSDIFRKLLGFPDLSEIAAPKEVM